MIPPLLAGVALAGVSLAIAGGARRWRTETRTVRERLDAGRVAISPAAVDLDALDGLPPPVQRYFLAALSPGRPVIAAVGARQRGWFDLGGARDRWRPFTADQRVVTRRPGFDWDARIALAPGLAVRVRDAYVAGEGLLCASLLGALPLARLRGGGDLARSELMRFLAEAVWYPTALLPGQGVRWEADGERSAAAALADGPVSATLRFSFGAGGLVETVRAEARGRTEARRLVPTPWLGRFRDYADRDGVRVPLEGEAAWLLPGGSRPYWRGRLAAIAYEYAG